MAECLGCSDSTVKRALQSMVEKGVIKRIGSSKKGEWIILNVNDNYGDQNCWIHNKKSMDCKIN